MNKEHYTHLDALITAWVDAELLKVEAELKTNNPSEAAFLALQVDDTLRTATERQRRYPSKNEDILSYRSADLWKFAFAAPMLITKDCAAILYDDNINPRGKAYLHTKLISDKKTVIIYPEHAVTTASQRLYLPSILIKKQNAGELDFVRFKHTAHARELLLRNRIVLMPAWKGLHLSVSKMPNMDDSWSRYHSHSTEEDILPFMINRRWFKRENVFHARPEDIVDIKKSVKKENPFNVDEFWNLLVQES